MGRRLRLADPVHYRTARLFQALAPTGAGPSGGCGCQVCCGQL